MVKDGVLRVRQRGEAGSQPGCALRSPEPERGTPPPMQCARVGCECCACLWSAPDSCLGQLGVREGVEGLLVDGSGLRAQGPAQPLREVLARCWWCQCGVGVGWRGREHSHGELSSQAWQRTHARTPVMARPCANAAVAGSHCALTSTAADDARVCVARSMVVCWELWLCGEGARLQQNYQGRTRHMTRTSSCMSGRVTTSGPPVPAIAPRHNTLHTLKTKTKHTHSNTTQPAWRLPT
jgi:hypothetical protein